MTTRTKKERAAPKVRTSRTLTTGNRSDLESQLVKALNSPALNGGFDTLLNKVSKIEETQSTLVTKVTSIHEAIYEPDDGLFARIKEGRVERDKDVIEIQAWRQLINRDLELDAVEDKELKQIVNKHEIKITELKSHTDRVKSVIKWVVVAIAGGGFTMLFEWISTFIS